MQGTVVLAQPLSFLYKTLFSLDGIVTHTPAARRLVMDIVGKIDAPVPHEERNQRNTLLSSEFIMHNHSSVSSATHFPF